MRWDYRGSASEHRTYSATAKSWGAIDNWLAPNREDDKVYGGSSIRLLHEELDRAVLV